METILALLLKVGGQVWATLQHNWPFLVISIFIAAGLQQYINRDAIVGFLRRYEKGGVLAATAAAVGTPLCSCGTTAILLGMMAGTASGMPWAPIIAFMVASPLTSPEELVYSAGLFGWPFAIAFFAASIVLGLAGGLAGAVLDARGWLRNQARFAPAEAACDCAGVSAKRALAPRPALAPVPVAIPLMETCGCSVPVASNVAFMGPDRNGQMATCGCDTVLPLFVVAPEPCGCDAEATGAFPATGAEAACGCGASAESGSTSGGSRRTQFDWMSFLRNAAVTGRRLLVLFLAFTAVGYVINDLIPTAWITSLFGSDHAYGIPLAATLGLPFYINTEASLPLVRGMLEAGMSSGAALAFLITGAGTSIGEVAGALTIARWRVVGLVIATLWVGAILCGFAYDALLAASAF